MADGNGQQTAAGTALALMAKRVSVEPLELQQTLMDTVFKGATKPEFVVLVAMANAYDLNPMAKELYAFPKKGGGIVPMVPIDGWLKIIKRHPDFAGMDVRWAEEMVQPAPTAKRCPEWVEVTIHHKSTPEHPTVHREWIDEMYRDTGPWNQTTKRMLEWKGISQAGRVAFGLAGIYDQDEAERISAGEIIDGAATEVETLDEESWRALVDAAAELGFTADDVLANAASLGFEGNGDEMPRDVAVAIYKALREAAEARAAQQPSAEAATATQEPASGDDSPSGDPEDQQPLTEPDPPAARRPRSAAQMGAEVAAKAAAKAEAEKINTAATFAGIYEAELASFLDEQYGSPNVADVPSGKVDEVLAWIKEQAEREGAA